MGTRITIIAACELRDGSVMISGSVEGPFLAMQNGEQHGCAVTSAGNIKVLLTGVAMHDPTLMSNERQGILIKMVEGDASILVEGVALDFGGQNHKIGE